MKRGVLVYNPTAGQRDRRGAMSALIDRQRRRGLELVNAPTSGPGDATEIVRTFVPRGLDVVAVCGGDGTISEAAWGLKDSEVPLAVLPGGTSNVLAIELGIPTNLARAEALLHEGRPHVLRLAHADGRPFLLWAGAGLDARVMANMRFAWKRLLGRTGILPTALAQFLVYEFPRLEVTVDGDVHAATFAVACRASHYGGRWVIAPDARLDADAFDVLLFAHRSRRKLAQLFQLMAAGRAGHLEDGLARIVRGREVSMRSLDGPVEVQVDGDAVLKTPVSCRVGDETVRVLVPTR
ncbi:MAG TPA: diacylglycerol kinase family protein [Thermoanaerobaculia bacterium]|nr:diacylglycerol kinase family protein [Thermoanaerobaculia bacterium]